MDPAAIRLEEAFTGETLVTLTFTDPRAGGPEDCRRVSVRPLVLRGVRVYQFACRSRQKETHRNLPPEDALSYALTLLKAHFRQARLQTTDSDHHISVGRNGRATVRTQPISRPPADARHDRARRYLLPEGEPCAFLARTGVMTPEGRVIAARYDKYRQINRFLEMVADVAGELDTTRPLRVVDFGCGKSYLTFALHHYLRHVRRLDVEIVGLDLKADVIAHCGGIAEDLQCAGLRFEVGDIAGFDGVDRADMVVSLHACDTATDDALAKAVRWGAKVIMAVPCCQHELFQQVDSAVMRPLLKHGILKERLSSLVTDALRAGLLEQAGYAVQVMEFIETEHTPKNLLLRAIRREDARPDPDRLAREYAAFRDFWSARPHLERVLGG